MKEKTISTTLTNKFPTIATKNSFIVKPNPDVICERLGNDMVLLNLKTNQCYELNSTGAKLWDLLSSNQNLLDVLEKMLCEFDIDAMVLTEEMEQIIILMQQEELISICE